MRTIKEVLAKNVSSTRDRLGLTQDQLESKSGVPKTTIQNVEYATTEAKISTLVKLANAMGVTVDFLITDPADLKRKSSPRQRLFGLIGLLTDARVDTVLSVTEALVGVGDQTKMS